MQAAPGSCGFGSAAPDDLMAALCARRSALILYRQILDAIETNGYDNFSKRAYVPKWRKFMSLPVAYTRALLPTHAALKSPK